MRDFRRRNLLQYQHVAGKVLLRSRTKKLRRPLKISVLGKHIFAPFVGVAVSTLYLPTPKVKGCMMLNALKFESSELHQWSLLLDRAEVSGCKNIYQQISAHSITAYTKGTD